MAVRRAVLSVEKTSCYQYGSFSKDFQRLPVITLEKNPHKAGAKGNDGGCRRLD